MVDPSCFIVFSRLFVCVCMMGGISNTWTFCIAQGVSVCEMRLVYWSWIGVGICDLFGFHDPL